MTDNVLEISMLHLYSSSRLQGPLFNFFTIAFVFVVRCKMGTIGDVKLNVCIHVDKSILIDFECNYQLTL